MTRRGAVLLLVIGALVVESCTSCHDTVLSSADSGEYSARVVHRVCGSASGFSVQIYARGGRPPGHGEGDLEPFNRGASARLRLGRLLSLP